ncbi:MAG: DUF4230 domain-containing protein [Lachnospiraceae bacterium]|nr:DUF4230 domain-containing protein [Lachnospiraceae bacterium]
MNKFMEKLKNFGWVKYVTVLFAGLAVGLSLSIGIITVKWIIDEIRYKSIIDKETETPIAEEETTELVIEEKEYTLTVTTVKQIVKPASDLVTTKYYYSDVDVYENYKELFGIKIPLTTDKVVFTYEGVINVGIDLADIEYIIDNKNKTITIKMPKIKVISNDIDEESLKIPFESNSIFNSTNLEDYSELFGALEKEREEALLANTEFINSALNNAKTILEQLLTVADETNEYKVIFK